MSTPDRSTTEEFGIATLLFTAISLVSWYAQKITLIRFWDSDEYYWMTYNLATHQPIRASAPWVFRILIPWLASFPGRCALTHGYRTRRWHFTTTRSTSRQPSPPPGC